MTIGFKQSVLITPPTNEPLTLTEAKSFLRVDGVSDDALISALITAARLLCELWTGRALITQTWQLRLDVCPQEGGLILPKTPVQNVDHIKIYDLNDNPITLAASQYKIDNVGARIALCDEALWGLSMRQLAGFEVQYQVGFGSSASTIPEPLRQGMRLHLSRLYQQRGDWVAPDGHALRQIPDAVPQEVLMLYYPYRHIHGGAA